jgi:hypothetical protein
MSSMAWSAPHPVGSHPLPTVPMSGQPCSAVLLSRTVAAYSHVL